MVLNSPANLAYYAIIPSIFNQLYGGDNLSEENGKPKSKWDISGLFIPAGLFIGMGIGWALGYLVQGMFVGLGSGFALTAIIQLLFRK